VGLGPLTDFLPAPLNILEIAITNPIKAKIKIDAPEAAKGQLAFSHEFLNREPLDINMTVREPNAMTMFLRIRHARKPKTTISNNERAGPNVVKPARISAALIFPAS
jgi:hypothetical protein